MTSINNTLAGFDSIRTTLTGKISLYDFLLEVCEKKTAHMVWKRLVEQYPELRTICDNFQFPGQGQRPTR